MKKLLDSLLEDALSDNGSVKKNLQNSEDSTILYQEIQDRRQNREERLKYAKWTFVFLCIFTFIVFLLVYMSGVNMNFISYSFSLSESVLITLITTSFSTVVGIFIFVMRYLFKNNS